MPTGTRPAVPPRRYHVGRRSTAFDIVDQPLLVVEYIDGVAPGLVESGSARGTHAVTATHEKGGPAAGHRAFPVEHGAVFKIRGVEHRPVAVEKYVRYDQELGFVEVDETAFKNAARPEPSSPPEIDLPDIEGTDSQVTWATNIRQQMIAALITAERQDLFPAFRRRKFASFYINLAHEPGQWVGQLEAVLKAPPRKS